MLSQFTDFSALIKDGLLGFVGGGNLVLGVVTEPEELGALPSHQEGGLGETGKVSWWHGWARVTDLKGPVVGTFEPFQIV